MGSAQISVGRLGVITEVDLRIVPQRMLTRIVTDETFDELVTGVEAAASAYSAALAANASAAEALRALAPLDMTQARRANASRVFSVCNALYRMRVSVSPVHATEMNEQLDHG